MIASPWHIPQLESYNLAPKMPCFGTKTPWSRKELIIKSKLYNIIMSLLKTNYTVSIYLVFDQN